MAYIKMLPTIKKMKKACIILFILLINTINSYGQRYLTDDFPVIDSIIGGIYGTAVNYQLNNQNLLFDFYEPASDVLTERPLLIYLHGGGFTSGSRSYLSVQQICRRMAKKGYAVANIDYRLDPNFDLYNSSTDRRAMTDAMHDAKQAIRYFKANASVYGIDTTLIFIGGESAGAITSMMAAYVDKQSEMTTYPMANPNDPIGSTNNVSFSNTVAGTLCLCGMLLDTSAIESPTDPPILWIHGDADSFIPIFLSFNIVLRSLNIGLPIQTKVYQGATHCPWYYGNPNWSTYLDSTISEITTFLYPKVSSTTGIIETDNSVNISVYPNPFESLLNINLNESYSETTIRITSSWGQIIFETSYPKTEKTIEINLQNVEPGIYFVLVENGSMRTVKKIIKII